MVDINPKDILSFINSNTEREYLRQICYSYSSLEAAFFVYQCARASMEERFAAWEWILANLPDCDFPKRRKGGTVTEEITIPGNIHGYLKEYMEMLRRHQIDIRDDDNLDGLNEHERALYDWLEEQWLDIPTPFRAGDIVYDVTGKDPRSHDYCKGAFVLIDTNNGTNAHKGCDYTDMTARGYFLDETDAVYAECIWTYLNLEYYPYRLSGTERILIAIGNYMKGEIDLALLLTAQRKMLLDKQGVKTGIGNYTRDGLALAGLIENDCEEV